MSIVKMSLVNIRGDKQYLDEVLLRCTNSSVFHPENATTLTEYTRGLVSIKEENPYEPLLKRVEALAASLRITLPNKNFAGLDIPNGEIEDYVTALEERTNQLLQKRKGIEQITASHERALAQLNHFQTLKVSFDELFSCQFVEIRFGRLSEESYEKLGYYQDKPFLFFSFDNDGEYHWCVYICAAADKNEIDGLFASLFFERQRVPDYAHGTPESAREFIETDLVREKKLYDELQVQLDAVVDKELGMLAQIRSKLMFLADAFDMRKYTAVLSTQTVSERTQKLQEEIKSQIENIASRPQDGKVAEQIDALSKKVDMRDYSSGVKNEFVVIGFIPKSEEERFRSLFADLPDIRLNIKPPESDPRLTPPVQLKNNFFAKPFEMFTEMYGAPGYDDIDPTPIVAVTYSVLFGIMFGDLGQGLLIAIAGFLLGHFKRMQLGKILARAGICSAIMGLVYGSVFGFEEALDPLYHAIGLPGKPIHVLASSSTMTVLGTAIGIGALLILMAMVLNIILGIRHKDWGRALLSQNGVVGLFFYVSVLYAAVQSLVFQKNVTGPLFYTFCVGLPIAIMFFKEPLAKMLAKKKELFHGGVGSFIAEAFFELFEVMLSFISNTMSFLRVGGFVLSHAGMMLVVFSLSEMVGTASPVVIIFGNLLVMGLEGLLVGIQVLRLEFYEIFSRFFDGDGKPFQPVVVQFDPASQ